MYLCITDKVISFYSNLYGYKTNNNLASYIDSQPKQFQPYTPTIDSQVYGQLLAKNDTDYQAGVQKVNSYLQSVASLPVASEEERQYLQGLVGGVTSQVNKMVGADWSDQKVQGSIATMASSIYGDEKVQKAVANAATAKRMISDAQEDEDRTKGQNTANKFVAMQQLNNWRGGHTLGSTLSATYDNYIDANKMAQDYWAKKHPDQKINVQFPYKTEINTDGSVKRDSSGNIIYKKGSDGLPLLDISRFEAQTNTWKGLTAAEVESEMRDFVGTDPTLQNQLNINAQYKGRNYSSLDYYKDGRNLIQSRINTANQDLSKINSDLLKALPGTPFAEKLSKQQNDLKANIKSYETYRDNGLIESTYRFDKDPSYRNGILQNQYTDDWLHSQSRLYAYGEESIDFKGNGPISNMFEKARIDQTNRSIYDKEQSDNKDRDLAERKFAWEKDLNNPDNVYKLAQTAKANREGAVPPFEIQTTTNVERDPYKERNESLLKIGDAETASKNDFMFGEYQRKGIDPTQYFRMEKSGTTGTMVPVPIDNKSFSQITKDYNDLRTKVISGDTTLPKSVVSYFNATKPLTIEKELKQNNLISIDSAWIKQVSSDPVALKMKQQVDNYVKPFSINKGGVNLNFNNQELKDFQTLYLDKKNFMNGGQGYGVDPSDWEKAMKTTMLSAYKDKGGTEAKFDVLYNHFNGVDSKQQEFLNQETEFKSNMAKNSDFYTKQYNTLLSGGDEERNRSLSKSVTALASREGKDIKLLGGNPEKYTIVGTRNINNGDYQVIVQPPNDVKNSITLTVKPEEAKALGIPVEDMPEELTRLSLNDVYGKGGNTGVPSLGGFTYEAGIGGVPVKDPKTGNDINYRYGLTHSPTGYYYTVFKKNNTTGEKSTYELPEYPNPKAARSDLTNHLNGLTTVKKTSSKIVDNNTNRNSK